MLSIPPLISAHPGPIPAVPGELRQPSPARLIVIACSAGGVEALQKLLPPLPIDFQVPIVIAQHLCPSSTYRSVLDDVVRRFTTLRVKWAEDGECLCNGTLYLAPQDRHVWIQEMGCIRVSCGDRMNFARPAANPLFTSAAQCYGNQAIGVVLSGGGSDGSEGALNLVSVGARVFTQDLDSSHHSSMPLAAKQRCGLGVGLTPGAIGLLLASICLSETRNSPPVV